ncbi:hypothetical protein CVT25_009204 [Psilocybe cyanescens]|uniref:O-methyltransferase C-terminal domain-containing protein n=1 Tax=Psilocybe cyanescens TaxID=93625 RepID=A0A409WWI6_PSICY|nr:hypothetical protein CVT25_009204 [Psilocybe cyanescens]
MSHPHGQILSLAALISDAAKVVEAHYESSAQPDVPSLDDTDPHTLDERSSKESRTAIQIIEGACAQLSATVARLSHTIVNFYEPNCLNVALTFKTPDVLQENQRSTLITRISPKALSGALDSVLSFLGTSSQMVPLFAISEVVSEISPCSLPKRIPSSSSSSRTYLDVSSKQRMRFGQRSVQRLFPRTGFNSNLWTSSQGLLFRDAISTNNYKHDWPDADSIKILSNVQKAMAPHSRVLVQEYILQHANRLPAVQSIFTQAPEPMLPNFGAGRIRQYNLDLDMMAAVNSQERRLPEFVKLGEAAGLKFVKLWDFGGTGLVEYQLP